MRANTLYEDRGSGYNRSFAVLHTLCRSLLEDFTTSFLLVRTPRRRWELSNRRLFLAVTQKTGERSVEQKRWGGGLLYKKDGRGLNLAPNRESEGGREACCAKKMGGEVSCGGKMGGGRTWLLADVPKDRSTAERALLLASGRWPEGPSGRRLWSASSKYAIQQRRFSFPRKTIGQTISQGKASELANHHGRCGNGTGEKGDRNFTGPRVSLTREAARSGATRVSTGRHHPRPEGDEFGADFTLLGKRGERGVN